MGRSDWDDTDGDEPTNVDQDGVAALHDSEAGSDEEGLRDRFVLDEREAQELGVDLDPVDGPEPELD